MRIYGDLVSGNCLKVKIVADYLRLSYRWVPIDILKGESRTPDYLSRFPAGQVPGGRIRGRSVSGPIERDHPLSFPRERVDPA